VEDEEEEVALGADLGRAEPSSLTLLSSEERGEGRLSVSELLLAPPEKKKVMGKRCKRAGHGWQMIC